MRKALVLLVLSLACCPFAHAQMVGATNSNHGGGYGVSGTRLAGWSYGLSVVASHGVGGNDYDYYNGTYGIWGDAGYNITPQWYVGASLGLQIRKERSGKKSKTTLSVSLRFFFTASQYRSSSAEL